MSHDSVPDHFALLGLERRYAIDTDVLEERYRELQARFHPDKFAHQSDADKRAAMQWATRVNEAYQALKQPIRRARYLLELLGQDPQIETNTVMPHEFLLQQMEWREAVAEAQAGGAIDELEALHVRFRHEMSDRTQEMTKAVDIDNDLAHAVDLLRRMMFIDKLLSDIDNAIETLEA